MKSYKRLFAIFLSLVFIFNSTIVNVFAYNPYDSTNYSNEHITIFEVNDTRIDSYEDDLGNTILEQYVNGKLTQRNTVKYGYSSIEREFFESSQSNLDSDMYSDYHKDTINVDDYLTLETTNGIDGVDNLKEQMEVAQRTLGTIKYRTVTNSGPMFYGIRCSYNTSIYSSTYTINNYLGTVVDLISLLVAAISIPKLIISQYVTTLLFGLGIYVVGGAIKQAVSDTVSARVTEYKWNLVDTTNSAHRKNVSGFKYFITDKKSKAKNKIYYEGYLPKEWKTQALAVWFHNEMFSYSVWDVVGWS